MSQDTMAMFMATVGLIFGVIHLETNKDPDKGFTLFDKIVIGCCVSDIIVILAILGKTLKGVLS